MRKQYWTVKKSKQIGYQNDWFTNMNRIGRLGDELWNSFAGNEFVLKIKIYLLIFVEMFVMLLRIYTVSNNCEWWGKWLVVRKILGHVNGFRRRAISKIVQTIFFHPFWNTQYSRLFTRNTTTHRELIWQRQLQQHSDTRINCRRLHSTAVTLNDNYRLVTGFWFVGMGADVRLTFACEPRNRRRTQPRAPSYSSHTPQYACWKLQN